MKKLIVSALIAGTALSFGCAQRLGEFTVASTKNVPELKYDENTVPVEGEDCLHFIFGMFPVGNYQNRLQEAMDRAIDSGREKGMKGNILVNTRIYIRGWIIPLIYGQQCVVVKGELTKIKK